MISILWFAVFCHVTTVSLGKSKLKSSENAHSTIIQGKTIFPDIFMTERASGCSIDLVKRLAVKKATPPIFYSLKSGEILYPIDSRTLEIGESVLCDNLVCHLKNDVSS